MRSKIQALEARSASLEPPASQRSQMLQSVAQYVEDFLQNISSSPAIFTTADEGIGIYDSPITDDPISLEKALALLKEHVDRPGVNPAAPGYLAYIPGGGLYHSALGDYLAAAINRYAGVYFAAPGAVRMERMLLAWMSDFLGYPATAVGDLTSGGSIANLSAIVTAREAHNLKARDFERSPIYFTEQAHHSIDKAIRIAGLAECPQRFIPIDERYRMQAEALDSAIKADKQAGLNPWLIVCTAGTTDTGAVDPLPAIADIAEQHQLWMHVDGAYGAAFALCAEGKQILQGIERSDSLITDPHKGLFLPYGSGALLIKDGSKLQRAYHYQANYMQDQDSIASRDELSPADVSPELSRHFRALRLWLPLKLIGVAPFKAALEEKLLLARYFHQRLQSIPGFEVGPAPDLSVVTYRYLPKRGDANEFNRRLVQAVQQDGRVLLTSTLIKGQFTLRLAVLSFRSHLDTLDLALDILGHKAKELEETL